MAFSYLRVDNTYRILRISRIEIHIPIAHIVSEYNTYLHYIRIRYQAYYNK